MDLAAALNEELRELAAAGCPVIQVEEPPHHFACCTTPPATEKDLDFYTRAFNREVEGVNTEIWAHTCWGNPNQQSFYWERPSYERSLPYLMALNADVVGLECASSQGRDLPLLKHHKTNKKIAIGVINLYRHHRRATRTRRQPDPQGARVRCARAPHHHGRLRLRARRTLAPYRVLQVRVAGAGDKYGAQGTGTARGRGARRRPALRVPGGIRVKGRRRPFARRNLSSPAIELTGARAHVQNRPRCYNRELAFAPGHLSERNHEPGYANGRRAVLRRSPCRTRRRRARSDPDRGSRGRAPRDPRRPAAACARRRAGRRVPGAALAHPGAGLRRGDRPVDPAHPAGDRATSSTAASCCAARPRSATRCTRRPRSWRCGRTGPRPGRAATGLAALRVRTVDQKGRAGARLHALRDAAAARSRGPDRATPTISTRSPRRNRPARACAAPVEGWDLGRFARPRRARTSPSSPSAHLGSYRRRRRIVRSRARPADAEHRHRPPRRRLSPAGRLVYGGHTIGIAAAQATRALPNLVTIVAWHGCDHLAPVLRGRHPAQHARARARRAARGRRRPGPSALARRAPTARAGRSAATVLDWRFVGVLA